MKNLCLFLFLLPTILMSQNIWSPFDLRSAKPSGERFIAPKKSRAISLDLNFLRSILAAAPDWSTAQAAENEAVALEIPMPDGSFKTFKIWRADVLHPDLAKRFPEIKSYAGHEIGDRTTSIRCDITPRGFHAMVLSATENTVFIDPIWWGDMAHYQVYFKKDFAKKTNEKWVCGTTEDGLPAAGEGVTLSHPLTSPDLPKTTDLPESSSFAGDCGKLRKYRLALSCTGEYATFHGGTTALALAAMTTSMVRINGIYERDLGVTMQIVANNNLVIFLNAATDPFDNTSLGQMIGQNQTTCDAVIGTANYDVGHVFGTQGGGLACLFCPCTTSKATAGTGIGSPVGDPFDVDYVAHEMGHQFGGRHTQSNAGCNNDNLAANETGSGSTIMAYAGICPPNVQNFSDDYFTAVNLRQMGVFITTGSGSTCPTVMTVANSAPTAAASVDKTLPISTPFALTGTGTDPNGDPLTFCWEQQDIAIGTTMPPVATNTTGPMFRTLKATTNPVRHFPNLPDLAAGINPTWEELPSVNRTMNFTLTVRDNHPGGGCTTQDDIKLTFNTATGPFLVTAPNTTGISWNVGATQTVTWNVANTTAAPVSCANVKLLLSTDGGLTYPTVLAASVANSGTAPIVVPNTVSTTCRVRVEAIGNYFFDISDKNFTIKIPPIPTFVATALPLAQSVCAGNPANFSIDLQSILGFADLVNLSAVGNPPGSTVVFSQNPATTGTIVTCSITNISVAVTTVFPITITAASGSISQNQTVFLTALPGAPSSSAAPQSPVNFATGLGTSPTLTWAGAPAATAYFVEISTNPAFSAGSIISSGTVAGTSFLMTNGTLSTVYYWRVKPSNQCGDGAVSTVFAFQTGGSNCSQTFTATDVPKAISVTTIDSITSNLTIPAGWFITDLNVSVAADHAWVGDLAANLISPSGTVRQLFDQPGVPASDFGCNAANISILFDDEAAQTAAQLEGTCGTGAVSISGDFQPIQPLSSFDGPDAAGVWQLKMYDRYPADGGSLTAWGITICYAAPISPAVLLVNKVLSVAKSGQGAVSQSHLSAQITGTTGQVLFTIINAPTGGVLLKNASPLAIGGSFTQAEINGGQVVYLHGGGAAATDQFTFDLVDQNGSNWLPNQAFHINIIQNTLAASLVLTQNINCAGGANGSVTASATGGTAPLEYSLNGGNFQQSPIFQNLSAGNFTVTVRDANGFSISTNQVAGTNPAPVSASTAVNSDDVTASGAGGTGSLTYSIDGQNFSQNTLFSNLANGIYTITVRDENGCTAAAQAVVAVNSLLVGAQIQSQIACAGGSNGAVLVTVGGGQSPFSFQFSNGTNQQSGLFENLPAGNYSATVTDGQGFSATSNTVVLNQPTAITASSSTVYYQINVAASGGTGSLSFSIDGQNFQGSPNFSVGQNGSFTITVRDQSGCTATVLAMVNVPQLTASAVVAAPIFCAGQTTAILAATGGGGQPPYQFSLNGTDFQPNQQFAGLGAGDFTVFIKDAAGNISSSTITVSAPSAVEVSAVVFGKKITASASGGTGALNFSLDGVNFSPVNIFENLPNGNYPVFAQDANGCIASVNISINYQTVVPNLSVAQPTCFGQTGSVEVAATGGIAPLEYSLDGVNFGQSPDFGGLAVGNFTVFVKDATGEVVTQAFSMSEPAQVTVSATVAGPNISFLGLGGAGNFTYLVNNISIGAATVFENAPPGNYTITAVDDNGCSASTTATVLPSTLIINVLDVKTVGCAGGTDGQFTVCVNGGQPPYSLAFVPNIGQQTPVAGNCALNVQLAGIPSGSYQVTVKDAFGFDQFLTISLPEPPALFASATSTGANNSSTVTVTATGGTGVLNYALDGSNFQPSNIFENVADGNHSIIIKDENGCTTTALILIMTIATGEAADDFFGLQIFPNPTSGDIQLAVNQPISTIFLLKITDAAGRILISEKTVLPKKMDLTGLPGGVYWISLTDGERAVWRKLVKI